jgi:prepilin-type N-terminal cleavage/methylation domain-containing protein
MLGRGATSRRRGFSLLELVVAATVASLLLGVALSNSTKIISQNNVVRAAQKLQTDVQLAFALSARNRKPVILRWSSSSVEMQVTDRTQTTIYRRSGVGIAAGLGLTSSDVTVYPTTLTVFPNGLAADTMYIRLTKNGFTRTLRMSKAGIVRLQ